MKNREETGDREKSMVQRREVRRHNIEGETESLECQGPRHWDSGSLEEWDLDSLGALGVALAGNG